MSKQIFSNQKTFYKKTPVNWELQACEDVPAQSFHTTCCITKPLMLLSHLASVGYSCQRWWGQPWICEWEQGRCQRQTWEHRLSSGEDVRMQESAGVIHPLLATVKNLMCNSTIWKAVLSRRHTRQCGKKTAKTVSKPVLRHPETATTGPRYLGWKTQL